MKSDSATTISGTSANTVVNVSELAVTPRRSCAMRCLNARSKRITEIHQRENQQENQQEKALPFTPSQSFSDMAA